MQAAPSRTVLAIALPLVALLAACGAVPVKMTVDSVSTIDQSATDRLVVAKVRFENPSTEQATLDVFRYRVAGDSAVYRGQRIALRTIPPRSTIVVELPAVLPAAAGEELRVAGTVEYSAPGLVDRILYRAGLYRPKLNFGGQAALDG
ncbi:MAG: hypothetical protein KDA22_07310 [Phycisphaerales bacterium]|nr:hypothetical protein [Phycisphaerales bacterium]